MIVGGLILWRQHTGYFHVHLHNYSSPALIDDFAADAALTLLIKTDQDCMKEC